MPFAVDRGRVAFRFQQFGDGHFVVIDTVFRARSQRAVQSQAIGITTRQQGRARGRANRLRDIKVGEANALFRHAIQVRRLVAFCAERLNIGIAHIVNEDDDHVGQALCERGRNHDENCGEKKQDERFAVHKLWCSLASGSEWVTADANSLPLVAPYRL